MSTELALRGATLPEKIDYAEHLAHAGLLPDVYRRQPANVLYAIEYGETIGIGTMAAITGVHVIKGKPTASSALISALVRRAGHKLRITGNDQAAVAIVLRADDPEFEYRSEWTLDRAVTAGLCELRNGRPWARDKDGKPTSWEKYPAAMLKARAITEVARDACEEVLFGLHYTPEELGAEVDADGEPVVQRARRQYGQTADDPWQTQAPAAPAAVPTEPAPAQEAEYAEVVEDQPPAATPEQVASILAALKAQGVNDREKARTIISEKAGRPIGAPTDLTAAEADRVVALLTGPAEQPDQQPDAAPAAPAAGTPDNPAHTPSQMAMIQATLTEKGITDPQAKRDLLGRILGVRVERVRDLSKEQAHRVIEAFRTGEIPASEPLVDRLAAQMRAAQSSDELADHAEWMWKAHEAGQLSEAEVSKLQDVSLEREGQLVQAAKAAA